MKKILVTLLIAVSAGSFAQTEKGMFFDANIGSRFGGATSTLVTLGPGFHVNGGMGYMFNNIIGIKGQLGYNAFKSVSVADEGIEDKAGMFSTSLEAVVGISQLIGFGTEKFDLYLHTGFGFSTISNPGYKEKYEEVNEFEDRGFKGNDESFLIPVGLSPTFHVNDKISLKLDLSYFVMFGQDNSLDREIGNIQLDDASGISFTTLGLTYRL